MKIELTNEEIARVFAMYWDARCVFGESRDDFPAFNVLAQVSQYPLKFRLLLTPLSKITDEHAAELAIIYGYNSAKLNLEEMANKGRNGVQRDLNLFIGLPAVVHQYLISKGYAVPLFFGIDHPANGKDAITLGIAIDSTIKETV